MGTPIFRQGGIMHDLQTVIKLNNGKAEIKRAFDVYYATERQKYWAEKTTEAISIYRDSVKILGKNLRGYSVIDILSLKMDIPLEHIKIIHHKMGKILGWDGGSWR
jgi:hypothetical protein